MIDWGNAGNSALTGAATGASFGSVVPVIGTALGAGLGGILGLGGSVIAQNRQQSLLDEAEKMINEMPKYENSDAYRTAATISGRADRWAQEGLSQQQLNQANQGIDRLASNALSTANTLESGLQGMSGVTATLKDSYANLAMQDAAMQQAQRAQALQAQQNFQRAQEDAFGVELGRQQNLLDLTLGEIGQSRTDSVTGQKNMMTSVQALLDSGALDSQNLSLFEQRKKAGMPLEDAITMSTTSAPLLAGGVDNSTGAITYRQDQPLSANGTSGVPTIPQQQDNFAPMTRNQIGASNAVNSGEVLGFNPDLSMYQSNPFVNLGTGGYATGRFGNTYAPRTTGGQIDMSPKPVNLLNLQPFGF